MRQTTPEGWLRDLECTSVEELSDLVVKLDSIWAEFVTLNGAKQDPTRPVALVIGVRKVVPQVFVEPSRQPCMTYEPPGGAVNASSDVGRHLERR